MASKNKNKRREINSNVATVLKKIPLVSVIIPVYNSAKFISQTLESLLYQTMKDFEVVVVDDCSTDNSVEVVESFAEKFGGRLHVIKLPKNTGTPGLPRNIGIQFARGKYICFLDSDDFFTKTALEELSTLAEKFQAEVVHTDTFFMLFETKPKSDEEYLMFKNLEELLAPENLTVCQRQKLPLTKEPIFETTNLEQRIVYWINLGYNWESVTMFCKRNFLIANQIKFPKLMNSEDRVFSFQLLCSAKKFLRIPNCTYIYRQRAESVSKKIFTDFAQHFNKWFYVMRDELNELEKIMEDIELFSKRPDYRYAVLNLSFRGPFSRIAYSNFRVPSTVLNDFVKKEFHPEEAGLALHLFNSVAIYQRLSMQYQQENIRLKKELQKYKSAQIK